MDAVETIGVFSHFPRQFGRLFVATGRNVR
jgi:hypothetical protein